MPNCPAAAFAKPQKLLLRTTSLSLLIVTRGVLRQDALLPHVGDVSLGRAILDFHFLNQQLAQVFVRQFGGMEKDSFDYGD